MGNALNSTDVVQIWGDRARCQGGKVSRDTSSFQNFQGKSLNGEISKGDSQRVVEQKKTFGKSIETTAFFSTYKLWLFSVYPAVEA
jgi:hypothetical protein